MRIAATLLAWLVVGCAPALAQQYQAEAGQCRFGLAQDGTFHQTDHHTDNYMTPRCGALGVTDKFEDGPWGWRIAFVWTGFIQARDNVTTFFDDDAFNQNLTCNNAPGPNQGRGCLVTINGYGHTWGFSFSGTYEQKLGWLRITPEAGLFFFRHDWHYQVTHIDCTTCPVPREVDESSGPFAEPSPLLGLTLGVGPVYIAARHYWPAKHRALSLTDHSFTQLSGGLLFRF